MCVVTHNMISIFFLILICVVRYFSFALHFDPHMTISRRVNAQESYWDYKFLPKYSFADLCEENSGKIQFEGSELSSLTFRDLKEAGFDKRHRYVIMERIQNQLLGPSFRPYSCFNPRRVKISTFSWLQNRRRCVGGGKTT